MKAFRLLMVLALTSMAVSATAMPNFARREGFACSVCHTTIPRLTRFGYEYRNSGFRTPNLIGEAIKDPTFGDMNAARIQAQAIWTRVHNEAAGTVTARGRMEFVEFTLYPATGSYGRWWSSLGEFSVAPEDFFEVENAYIRATFGKADSHFQVRAGVFHPFEGYGASDRPVALARPLLQTTPAKNTGTSTFFTPWGFDQVGVEAGYTYGPFNVAATLFNGIYVNPEENKAFPFQGGELVRPASDPNYNSKDFQAFANYFIPFMKNDAAVSAFYYHGTLSVPYILAPAAFYTDTFDRVALYATLPIAIPSGPSIWVLGGLQYGWDTAVDPLTGAKLPDKFRSAGGFGEAFVPVSEYFGATVRYDRFSPSHSEKNNAVQAFTVAASVVALNGLQAILEYQVKDQETGPATSTNTNQVRLRLIGFY